MRAFINTARLEDGAEGFDEAGSLAAWLRGRDLLAAGAGVAEQEREESSWRRSGTAAGSG